MKVVVYTLGCKVSQYESDLIMEQLIKQGYEVSKTLEKADIYIVNTCAVTNEAERKSRGIVAKINKLNENARIIICGCASENSAEQFLGKKNVSLILGTSNKNQIASILDKVGIYKQEISKEYEEFGVTYSSRARAYLKIQEGCNNFCSYCLIPFIRGRSRSRDLDNIIKEANELAKTCKEIVVTGINMSDYRIDGKLALDKVMLALKDVKANIRISSLEVNIITKEFLDVLKSMPNFCPQFHLSMQSGCDRILKLMNRHYTVKEYLDKVKLIRQYFDNASITTDVIVGFPTETEQDFLETLDTCKKANFFQMHIFPYSKRNGTKAEKMEQVDGNVVKERISRLNAINKQMHNDYLMKNIGKTSSVVTEQEEDGYVTGHSSNYIKTYLPNDTMLYELAKVEFTEIYKDGMKAKIVSK